MKKKIWTIALFVFLVSGAGVVMGNTLVFPQQKTDEKKEKKEVKPEPPIEKGKVTVDKTIHDFETISENGGTVSTLFTLRNNTDKAVLITKVNSTCGCTTPNWTKEPIEPGKTAEVMVVYNPKGRVGPFNKGVTITTTGLPGIISVRIKGVVE